MKMAFKKFTCLVHFLWLFTCTVSAQTVIISGSIADTATLMGVPNAVVSLVEDPTLKDTTDAYGNFSLGGMVGIIPEGNRQKSNESIILQGNRLTLTNAGQSDATSVQVYNSTGMRIFNSRRSTLNGTVTFGDLWQSPGLYFVKVQSRYAMHTLTCLGLEKAEKGFPIASNRSVSGMAKQAAGYTLSIKKIGYASKQVVAAYGKLSEPIKMQALPAALPVKPMPIISQNVPAFSSSDGNGSQARAANDTNQSTAWTANGGTGWLAYDLSSRPLAARQMVLLAWYDPWAGDYFYYNGQNLAKDYTIEINMGPGGGVAPTDGWISVLAVTNNQHNARQHEINMQGANWIRINVSASYLGPLTLDMDIYDVSNGITDFWLLMGDSITFMSMQRLGNDLQNRVRAYASSAWPGLACAAEGGTSSTTGLQIINDVLASFPGKFITLNYGTNDHPQDGAVSFFNRMDTLCMKIIAAGKTPVIPSMPWPRNSDSASAAVEKINMLNQLYAKYPTQVIPGPDLWTLFKNHPTLLAAGDVHPGSAGQDSLRAHWVMAIDSLYAH